MNLKSTYFKSVLRQNLVYAKFCLFKILINFLPWHVIIDMKF